MSRPSRWLVSVGIDCYSTTDPGENLKGAANDAVLMYHFMRDTMGTPESNIQLLLSRDPKIQPPVSDPLSVIPTVTGFLKSLDQVMAQARSGDLVHIHFSGHGAREPTARSDKKGRDAVVDELLCFVDADLDDVEFGEKLDEMAGAPHHLVVSTSLDCCFSGGATRAGYTGVRCKPQNTVSGKISSRGQISYDVLQSGGRNAVLQTGWLYRNRGYSVMAACQPFEESKERHYKSTDQIHGVFTFLMVSHLRELGNRRAITTYGELQGALSAAVTGTMKTLGVDATENQRPMLLGPRERVVFDSMAIHAGQKLAYVIGVSENMITLNRGQASGARLFDVYQLQDSGDSATLAKNSLGIEVVIVSMDDYESFAKTHAMLDNSNAHGLRDIVQLGWAAKLVRRADPVRVCVTCESIDTSAVSVELLSEVQTTWISLLDATVPIHLDFSPTKDGAREYDFYVCIRDETFDITDADGRFFNHLSGVCITRENVTVRLLHVLAHLQSFKSVLNLTGTKNSNGEPKGYLTSITETERLDDDNVASSWLLSVHNLSAAPIFVSVLDMTPLYGIHQLIPFEVGIGHVIEPGEKMEETVDIEVPASLRAEYQTVPTFCMKDVLKVFITTEPIDLHHLELEDIDITLFKPEGPKSRSRSVRSGGTWYVEEKEIITRSRCT